MLVSKITCTLDFDPPVDREDAIQSLAEAVADDGDDLCSFVTAGETPDTTPGGLPLPQSFEMYTEAGNLACREACIQIEALAKDRTIVWNKATLDEHATPIIDDLTDLHPEVGDTEPRGHFNDFLDLICQANGWAYNDWEGHF